MLVKDKGWHNYSIYEEDGYGLTFDDFQEDKASYIKKWYLSSTTESLIGDDIPELLNALEMLIARKGLKVYSESKKDIVIIYTNRIQELYYYLFNYVSNVFPENATKPLYFQVLDIVEFRECWNTDLDNANDISVWAKGMMDKLFIPDNCVYLTPSQVSRKRIMKQCKAEKITIGKDIFPTTYTKYDYIRKALYGGICYCPFKEEVFERPIIEIDLKSAYIFCFLMKHCISSGKWVDSKNWERYLGDDCKHTIGEYKITYTSWSKKVLCYKTKDGLEPGQSADEKGICTDTFIFDEMDIKIFIDTVNVMKIECLGLIEFDTGYIPKPYIDCVLDLFKNKEHTTGIERAINKIAVNSVYGNTARRYDTRKAFKEADTTFPTQWGVFITSYCKNLVIGLAKDLDGWIYSDTDSIFCFDTPENREKIKAYNEKTQRTVKEFCDKFGYDFEEIKNLGTFVIEEEIIKFKAWKQKQYAFKTKEGKVIVKASGCQRREHNDAIFEMEKVPVGEKVVSVNFQAKECKTVKDGKEYKSETSYYNRVLVDEEVELYYGLMSMLAKGEHLTDD